jgi:hypothetical protein
VLLDTPTIIRTGKTLGHRLHLHSDPTSSRKKEEEAQLIYMCTSVSLTVKIGDLKGGLDLVQAVEFEEAFGHQKSRLCTVLKYS